MKLQSNYQQSSPAFGATRVAAMAESTYQEARRGLLGGKPKGIKPTLNQVVSQFQRSNPEKLSLSTASGLENEIGAKYPGQYFYPSSKDIRMLEAAVNEGTAKFREVYWVIVNGTKDMTDRVVAIASKGKIG